MSALNDFLAHKSVARIVVGEFYTIKDIECKRVENKYKPGEPRLQVVLITDRGRIWAPSGMCNAIEKDGEIVSRETLQGLVMRGVSYHSKNYGKDVITLEACDQSDLPSGYAPI